MTQRQLTIDRNSKFEHKTRKDNADDRESHGRTSRGESHSTAIKAGLAKSTPGPWTSNLDGQIQCEHINHYGNWIVATIGREMTEEDHANARLIAAAPELLAACKEMVNEARERNRVVGYTQFNPAALEIAIAAIAKATNE